MMRKMDAQSVADLVRRADQSGLQEDRSSDLFDRDRRRASMKVLLPVRKTDAGARDCNATKDIRLQQERLECRTNAEPSSIDSTFGDSDPLS
jgi:hypothetical protein